MKQIIRFILELAFILICFDLIIYGFSWVQVLTGENNMVGSMFIPHSIVIKE